MAHRGKIYRAVKKDVPTETVSVSDAVQFVKGHVRTTFDETIELHVHLGIDASKSDQFVRGSVSLPSGAPTQKRVAVFTADAAQQAAARAIGATIVGGEELVAQIEADGSLAADIAVATPELMPKIARVARILGPQGLMPNPKTGTVSPDPVATVKELMGGKLTFKMDQLGNIHEAVGKASWDTDKVVANIDALVDALKTVRPATARGQFLATVTVASTMGPGVRVAV